MKVLVIEDFEKLKKEAQVVAGAAFQDSETNWIFGAIRMTEAADMILIRRPGEVEFECIKAETERPQEVEVTTI